MTRHLRLPEGNWRTASPATDIDHPVRENDAGKSRPDVIKQQFSDARAIFLETAAAAKSDDELFLIIANQPRSIAEAQQIFVFWNMPAPRIVAVSSMPGVNRQSPLVQDLEHIIRLLLEGGELNRARMFSLGEDAEDVSAQLKSYPFRSLIWTPIPSEGHIPSGGILYTRRIPWKQEEVDLLEGFAEVFKSHLHTNSAHSGLSGDSAKSAGFVNRKKISLVVMSLLLIGLSMPTTMAVNAPFNVVSRDHVVVSSPIQGVIETLYVKPGDKVATGQPLVKFVDIAQKNRVSIAQREVDLSEAVLKRTSQLSFEQEEGRSQLGSSMAEVEIKRAELELAQEQYSRTTINAAAAGIVIFSDEKSLLGRPFSIGERILDIANPDHVEFEISLDISNSIELEKDALVRIFPDSTPLRSLKARLTRLSYLAEPDQVGRLTHILIAQQADDSLPSLTLGTSGTAKIYGNTVPLAFYLFRRPIATVRQWLGV